MTGDGIKRYIDEQIEKIGAMDDRIARLIEETGSLEKELGRQAPAPAPHERLTFAFTTIVTREHPSAETLRVLDGALVEREQEIETRNKVVGDLRKQLSRSRLQEASSGIEALVAGASQADGFRLVAARVDAATMDELKGLGDTLRMQLGSGVGLLASVVDEKVALVCVVTDDLLKSTPLQAGKIVGAIARKVGGGGGGRPHLATAGGKDVTKLEEALKEVGAVVTSMLGK